MQNSIVNLGIENVYSVAIKELGYKLEDLYEEEIGKYRAGRKRKRDREKERKEGG
jgi:hypothetical protein